MLQRLVTSIRSMGLTFLLGFMLCIFQSSESILVKLSHSRPGPQPSSTKLLFLSELLKLIISYTLLCFERKQLVLFTRNTRGTCSCKQPALSSASHDSLDSLDSQERGLIRSASCSDDDDNDDDDDQDFEDIHHEKNSANSNNISKPTCSCSASTSSSPTSPTPNSSSDLSLSSSAKKSLVDRIPRILLFAVPGAIYFFNNNLTFVLLSMMPAPTYVVLSNLKILTTGILSYWFLKKLLTPKQWLSLGILFLSTAVSQVDLQKGLSLAISVEAFLLMVGFCTLSAFASVFSEYVMKDRFANESIHVQNMKLYMFGILFNGITYALSASKAASMAAQVNVTDAANVGMPIPTPVMGFFSDMGLIHFWIIMAYASLGLVTSAIIKYSGSITKVYASSMSMFFAALVSWMVLDSQLTALFLVGCAGCCYALHLYYAVPTTPAVATDATTDASTLSSTSSSLPLSTVGGSASMSSVSNVAPGILSVMTSFKPLGGSSKSNNHHYVIGNSGTHRSDYIVLGQSDDDDGQDDNTDDDHHQNDTTKPVVAAPKMRPTSMLYNSSHSGPTKLPAKRMSLSQAPSSAPRRKSSVGSLSSSTSSRRSSSYSS